MKPSASRDPRRTLGLAAVIFGLLSACLSFAYLRGQSVAAEPIPTVAVVTARQDIPARTTITPVMVELRQIPRDSRQSESFTDLSSVVGKTLKFPVAKGEQLINERIVSEKSDGGISANIPAGKRAVAIGINEVVSTGGLLIPGDFVDIIVVFDQQKTNKMSAGIVLQNIEVLAVGQTVDANKPETDASGTARQVAGAIAGPKSATLAVSLEEAQKLVLAEEFGRIRLAVRPSKDVTILPSAERDIATLYGGQGGAR